MTDFWDELIADESSTILVQRPSKDTVFTFSNSGRTGGMRNWFAMTSTQIVRCLEDLLAAGDILPVQYHEKTWRKIFADHLTDDVSRTMGAVQTLPLFELLAKIIHHANTGGPRIDKTINLEPTAVRHTIKLLQRPQ